MSGKVRITRKQADEVEIQKKELKPHDVVTRKIVSRRTNKVFKDIDLDTLIRALYIGYEVEPDFEVGDWVVHIPTGVIGEISHINGNWISFFHSYEQKAVNISVNDLRHATPEEIAKEEERNWWAKHGREPWELKEDDVLTRNDDGFPWFVGKKRDSLPGYYLDGEHFNLEDIRNNYRVMVFVHDRRDVDHGE